MSYQILEYLKFFLRSSNQHGVHSPFVYQLVTQCFYKKTPLLYWKSFLQIKKQLLNSPKKINVTDFGSGSKIFKSNVRKVSKIVTVAGISNRKAKLLIRLTNYFTPKNTLEIGTSLGLGTSVIKIGNRNTTITTLEGCPATSAVANDLFSANKFKNINVITGKFDKTLPVTTENKKYDFIYFDGNHTKKSTLNYFNECLKTTHNESVWVFDDIYWNLEMKEAWSIIKNHSKVTVSVDVFHLGIIFFRKEQAKEHFKIRI